mmetsp:Transcript_16148/g.1448  ORF Transcript_16148/g.1448 Transcript_16148/m.1448 type:complete len:115 (+) Transcript_16148:486-830(+)
MLLYYRLLYYRLLLNYRLYFMYMGFSQRQRSSYLLRISRTPGLLYSFMNRYFSDIIFNSFYLSFFGNIINSFLRYIISSLHRYIFNIFYGNMFYVCIIFNSRDIFSLIFNNFLI